MTQQANVRELTPGSSQVVSADDLARMYGKSCTWARKLLRDWYKEQQEHGGEIRVFRRPYATGHAHFTTKAVLQRVMPPARDMQLVRMVQKLDKDIELLAIKVDGLMAEREVMRKKIERLERGR